MAKVTMYGADWCGDCRRSKRVLDELGVEYDWIDVDAVPEAAERARELSGRPNIPVIRLPDGTVLTEPSDDELEAALRGGA